MTDVLPPHILQPSDTDVEIKASVHKNISLSIYFHYILIFLSEFEATTKRVWQARWVQCQKNPIQNQDKRWQQRWNKQVKAHIVCVDVPRHVTVRHKLSIHVASDLAVSPATVDVNDADHVPLKRKKSDWEDLVANYRTRPQRHARNKNPQKHLTPIIVMGRGCKNQEMIRCLSISECVKKKKVNRKLLFPRVDIFIDIKTSNFAATVCVKTTKSESH